PADPRRPRQPRLRAALRSHARRPQLLGLGLPRHDRCHHRHRHYLYRQQRLHHDQPARAPPGPRRRPHQQHPLPRHELLPRHG
ncbi:hypothetical protein BN1708_020550, partial [Verticillium longisporum]